VFILKSGLSVAGALRYKLMLKGIIERIGSTQKPPPYSTVNQF
jgi:hypothetical protein